MERLISRFAVLTAAVLISSMPVLAGDKGMGTSMEERTQKDECLLVARSCRTSVDSIQQRIDRLDREISRGSSVYSQEELRSLKYQMMDATRTLEVLLEGGA